MNSAGMGLPVVSTLALMVGKGAADFAGDAGDAVEVFVAGDAAAGAAFAAEASRSS